MKDIRLVGIMHWIKEFKVITWKHTKLSRGYCFSGVEAGCGTERGEEAECPGHLEEQEAWSGEEQGVEEVDQPGESPPVSSENLW